MKKKYIQLGVVVLLLVGMVAAYLLLKKTPAPAEVASSKAETLYVIGSPDSEPATQIDVKNEYGTYSIVAQKNADKLEPTIKGLEKFSLDTYGLGTAWESAKALVAKQVVTENATADDLATYGLNSPRASALITRADNSKATVLFGGDAPGGAGMYTKLESDAKVYLVASAIAEPYFRPNYAYVNKTISATDPEFKGFDKITFSGTNYPEQIVIERTPEKAKEAGGMMLNTHGITSPIVSGTDSQKGLEPLATLYGLLANEVVAVTDDAATLAKYGLTDPPTVVSVVGAEGNPEMTFKLRISAPDPAGEVYLIKDSTPIIYKLSASALPWLPLKLFDYMEKMALIPHIDTVSEVKVTLPDKTYVYKLNGTGDDLKVQLDGKDLTDVKKENGDVVEAVKNFKQFYQYLISASYDSPTDETIPTGAKPIVEIQYSYNNGHSPETLRFFAGPTRKVFMQLNSEKPYFTQQLYVDTLIENAAKMANGEVVKAY